MDLEVKTIVEQIWAKERNNEYDIVEEAYESIGSPCRFLEVGCGRLGLLTKEDRLQNLSHDSLGVDIDFEALSNNRQARYRICGDCSALPLKKNSINIIACRWLFEHLADPETAIQELSRVLKGGGYLLITTPNLLNYLMILSKLTPTSFHNKIRLATGVHENYATFYRANTKWKIAKLASRSGLRIKHIKFTPYSFMYYSFHKHLFFFMMSLAKFISKFSSQFHLRITCLMQKPAD